MPAPANLTFKRGLLSALGNQAVVDGTIYVTTDEGAMYVDVGNSRIRLGDFIPVNTLADLQNQSPLYETAVYYVKEGNILARYDITNQRWIQINKSGVVSVQNASGSAGVGNVISNISLSTDANGQLTLVVERASVSTDTALGQVQNDIQTLRTAINLLNATAETQGSVAYAVEQASAALLGNPSTYTTIEALETAVLALEQNSSSSAAIQQLQTDVNTLKSTIGPNDSSGLRARIKANEDAIALLNNSDATVQGSVKYAVAQGIAEIVASADARYDTLKEIADWILSDTTGAAAMSARINQATADITSLTTRISALEVLAQDSSYEGSVAYQIAQEASARATEDTRLAGLIATNTASINQLNTSVTNMQGSLTWREF